MKIFFDLDGPILDVSERYYRVFLEICKGDAKLNKKEFWELKRQKTSWSEILEYAKLVMEEEKFLRGWMRYIEMKRYLVLDKIKPHTKKILNSLRKKYTLYLISLRQSKKNLYWQAKKFKVEKYFEKVIHCRHTFDKPWREKARLIKENLAPGEDAFIVGDTEVDIRAAKLARIKSVGMTNGIRTKEILLKENPDFLATGIDELLQIID